MGTRVTDIALLEATLKSSIESDKLRTLQRSRSGKPPDVKELEAGLAEQSLEREKVRLELAKTTLKNDLAQSEIDLANQQAAVDNARRSREEALVRSPLDGVVVQIFSRQGERVSPAGIAKIVDMTQLRVLADVDELHVARLAPGGKVEVTFRGSPTVYKGKISRVAPTVKRMQRVEPDGASSTDARVVQVEIEFDDPIQHAAGAGTRDARHVPLMALILPDVPALRLRLLRLWSRVAQLRHWRPQFSLARVRSSARTATVMPLGVQQLKRQRTSTLLSLAGVTASLLVIFAQLGIERAVYELSVRLHRMVTGDLVVVPWGFKSMQLHAEVPVAVTDIVATNPSVASTSPFWFGVMSIIHSGIPTSRRIAWYAIDVERPAVDVPGLKENLYKLRETRRMLFDRDLRPYFGDVAEQAERGVEVPVWARPTIVACCTSFSSSAPLPWGRTS